MDVIVLRRQCLYPALLVQSVLREAIEDPAQMGHQGTGRGRNTQSINDRSVGGFQLANGSLHGSSRLLQGRHNTLKYSGRRALPIP
jgi:hypothetical protein